jgi:hypothetical protein
VSTHEPADVERLRAALASLAAEPGGDGGEEAPAVDAGRIFDALYGELGDEARQAVVDATVTDADAAEAWRLAAELAPDRPATVESAPRSISWTWLGLAAALVLAVGLGWQQLALLRTGETPVYRGGDGRTIGSLLPAGAPLSRQSPVLRWTPIEGARYRVRVLTSSLELLEEAADLGVPQYTVSADVVSRLPSGATLLWQVEAAVAGTTPVTSPTFTVQLQ